MTDVDPAPGGGNPVRHLAVEVAPALRERKGVLHVVAREGHP